MTKQTDKLKSEIVHRICEYIISNGTKLTNDFYYWNTYPVVIKDICVSYVVVNNGELQFGDFPAIHKDGEYQGDDLDVSKFKVRKTMDQLSSLKADREYLENSFSAMKIVDGKKLQKQWEKQK
jgi:hypothetical protein